MPEVQLLQHFLNKNTEFTDTLHTNDRVCYACYKSHLVVVKHIKNFVRSNDEDLKDLISEIKQNMPRLSEIKNLGDCN